MKPALKLDVLLAHFPYGGNGGVSSEIPQIRQWELQTVLKMKKDDRIGEIYIQDFSDTPITLTRNLAIKHAKKIGAHLILMIDSDNDPLKHAKEPWHKPFWDEAFDFIYKNYGKGPHVVGAPYCGPPNSIENIYVFHWESYHNRGDESMFKLAQYSRHQASLMSGIQECAALPTGLILFDMRVFDLVEPEPVSKRSVLEDVQSGKRTVDQALLALKEGIFYYEWTDCHANEKASTEDVTCTRDIALAGMAKLGYNPIHCAWDSWVGHMKPWNVGRPERFTTENINETYQKVVLENSRADERIIDTSNLNQGDDPWSRRLRGLAADALANYVPNGHSNGNGHVKEWHEYGHACEEHVEALGQEIRLMRFECRNGKPWPQPRVLEVGSWLATTAIAMADAGATVHCVDTWQGSPSDSTSECAEKAMALGTSVFEEFKSRVGDRLNKSIFAHQRDSLVAARMHWEPFDLIFIDADHSYESTKADILAWWKHLRDDGVMIGHDFRTQNFPGVTQAVKELFGDKVETIGLCSSGAMWKVRKSDFPKLEESHAGTLATHSY